MLLCRRHFLISSTGACRCLHLSQHIDTHLVDLAFFMLLCLAGDDTAIDVKDMQLQQQDNGCGAEEPAGLPNAANAAADAVAVIRSHQEAPPLSAPAPNKLSVSSKEAAGAAAAKGWEQMYDAADEAAEEAAAGADNDAAGMNGSSGAVAMMKLEGGASEGGTSQQSGLPLDAEGNLPFFLLDAYENQEGRLGDCMPLGFGSGGKA